MIYDGSLHVVIPTLKFKKPKNSFWLMSWYNKVNIGLVLFQFNIYFIIITKI